MMTGLGEHHQGALALWHSCYHRSVVEVARASGADALQVHLSFFSPTLHAMNLSVKP